MIKNLAALLAAAGAAFAWNAGAGAQSINWEKDPVAQIKIPAAPSGYRQKGYPYLQIFGSVPPKVFALVEECDDEIDDCRFPSVSFPQLRVDLAAKTVSYNGDIVAYLRPGGLDGITDPPTPLFSADMANGWRAVRCGDSLCLDKGSSLRIKGT